MTALLIISILFFLILDAFFAGSETALTSISRIRLAHLVESKNNKAIMINDFLGEEGHFLATTLVGTNISVVISSALATYLFSLWFGAGAAIISTALMTCIILIFCEIVPKTIFRQSANTISLKIIAPLKFMFRLLFPVIFIITGITKIFLKPFNIQKIKKPGTSFTKTDIEEIFASSGRKGLVAPDEKTLVQRIFSLGLTNAGKIMVPLAEVILVNADDSIDALKNIASKTRFSRFPVYENQKNNIIGIVNIYDVLFDAGEKLSVRDYIQGPYFINEDERVDKALSDLRKRKKPMAIVTNHAGASVGLITIEDVLEEIVGEIGG